MEKKGIVINQLNEEIKVRIDRDSACGGECGKCSGCGSKAKVVKVKTNEYFTQGDRVLLVMNDGSFLGFSAFGYLFPVLISVLGAIGGARLKMGEGFVVLGWIIGFTVGFLILKLVFSNKNVQIKVEKMDKKSDNKEDLINE